jgi:hypothetical protein
MKALLPLLLLGLLPSLAFAATEVPESGSGLHPALLIALAALAAVALFFGLAWLRHTMTRRRVTARFDQFKEHVIQLRQQVESLKERHQLLPAGNKEFSTPMAGATLALYQQLQQDFERLLDDWRRRMELWDRVEQLIASEKPLGAGRLHEAERNLDKLGSFDDVDKACRTCVAQLDRLEHGHERAKTLIAQAAETTGQLRQQLKSVRALELPTAPYEAELERCGTGVEQGRGALPADPLGAVATLESAAEKMTALGDWMQEIVRLVEKARKAHDDLEEVTRQAASRRAGGLLLTEPEGNPDPVVAQGRAEHAGALEALRGADAKTTAKHVKQAFALAKQAAEVIERQAAAGALCAKEVPARRADAQRLGQEAAAAEGQRHELERDFAPESWRTVADNLPRARDLQKTSEHLLQEAGEASAASVQHYFRAAGLLEQVQSQQKEAHGLLGGVGQCLQQLTALRQECQRQGQDVSDLARKVQAFNASHQGVVRQGARSRFDAAEEGWRRVRGQMEGPRPHWADIRQHLEEAQKGYAAALKEAEEDVRCYQQLMTKLGDVGREAERVGLFLRQHYQSRAPAGQCQRAAVEALERVRRESGGRAADWADLLRQVEEAAKGLGKAEQLAKEDVRLAERAESAIAEAERELERARNYYTLGIKADANRAADLLTQARRQLAAQEYEQAAQQAGTAQQAARQAYDEAVRRTQQEQQRQDQERQRQAAAAAAATAAAQPAVASPLMSPEPPPGPPRAEADDPNAPEPSPPNEWES